MTGEDDRRFAAEILPHLDAAYNLARWLTRNDADAQDIVQEAYLRAFRFFGGFEGRNAKAWLLSIVRNAFFTSVQGRAQHERLPEGSDQVAALEAEAASAGMATPESPEALLIRSDERRLVNEAIAALPAEFREALVLREIEELSYREIADVTGIPIGTVMSRLSRGRALLRQALRVQGAGL
jgi:RNA polymerase sigma-70 factor (ECF subfamily)